MKNPLRRTYVSNALVVIILASMNKTRNNKEHKKERSHTKSTRSLPSSVEINPLNRNKTTLLMSSLEEQFVSGFSALRFQNFDDVYDENSKTDSESDWTDAEQKESDKQRIDRPSLAQQGQGRPWAKQSRRARIQRMIEEEREMMRLGKREFLKDDDDDFNERDEDGDEGRRSSMLDKLDDDLLCEIYKKLDAKSLCSAAMATKFAYDEIVHGKLGARVFDRTIKIEPRLFSSKAMETIGNIARLSLKKLDVSKCRQENGGTTKAMIFELANKCVNLEEILAIDLGENGKFKVVELKNLAQQQKSMRLRKLTVNVSHLIEHVRKHRPDVNNFDESIEELVLCLNNDWKTLVGRCTEKNPFTLCVNGLKVHAACAISLEKICPAAARNGVIRFDASWSLRIGDAGIRAVARAIEENKGWKSLKRLGLRKSACSDNGARSLAGALIRNGYKSPHAKNPINLRWLDLASNDIGDAGVNEIALASLHLNLTRLYLASNRINTDGALALGSAFVHNERASLKRLDLSHNGLGDEGARALLSCGEVIRGASKSLKVLLLGFNSIGNEGIKDAGETFRLLHLEHLDLSCNTLKREGFITIVEKWEFHKGNLKNLKSINLNCNDILGGKQVRDTLSTLAEQIEIGSNLELLNLRGNDLDETAAEGLADLLLVDDCDGRGLEQLNVGYNKIYNSGASEIFEALEDNRTCLGLDLQRNEITDESSDGFMKAMTLNTSCEECDVRSNMFSPETVKELAAMFNDRVNARWQLEPPKKLDARERETYHSRRAKENK